MQDVCHDNFVVAVSEDAEAHPAVAPRRTYLIDFDTSRQLTLGPGVHSAITLPPTQITPPSGLKHFDPYSWDVYCLGHVFEDLMEVSSDRLAIHMLYFKLIFSVEILFRRKASSVDSTTCCALAHRKGAWL